MGKAQNINMEEATRLYAEGGWTTVKLGIRYGVSNETVRKAFLRAGIPLRRKNHSPVIEGNKQCTRCKEWKALDQYGDNPKTYDRKFAWCLGCDQTIRKANYARDPYKRWVDGLKKKYGMTPEEYEDLFRAQDGKCYLCQEPETRVTYGKVTRLAVDHSHTTGKVRSLLCASCNLQLGRAKENVILWQRMIDYINSQGD